MSVLYVDTSAALKRVIVEDESAAVRRLLRDRDGSGDLLAASSLAWVEVWRSLRRARVVDIESVASAALSGVAEFSLNETVLLRARRVGGDGLRSLDALHLASAVALDADEILTYDERLAESADALGIRVLAPSR